jgi:hypothetical protein
MTTPMLADFSLRLALGLTGMLLITPWKEVPFGFFRTHGQVILGLLVLAAIDELWSTGPRALIVLTITSAILAYVITVSWGIGLPRIAYPITAILSSLLALGLVAISHRSAIGPWSLIASGRLASSFLLGSTLTAMLLGHYYLTSPAMSIEPLKRFVVCMALALVLRTALSAIGVASWFAFHPSTYSSRPVSPMFLTMRWGMGILGPAIATLLSWKTVKIRSTQSATGILYIAMTLVLFGELTALILSRETDWLF